MNTLQQTISQFTRIQVATVPLSKAVGISAAILMGMIILYTVGFASSDVIHSAAHDLRHGLSFPCH